MIRLAGARYGYPGGVAVGPVDLVVSPGELVLLTGPTGCGKSTVLRLAAGLLQRHGHGEVSGEVRVRGEDPAGLVAARRVEFVGFVGQDPDDAIIGGSCADEVAFALESAGWAPAAIERRLAEVLARVGLGGLGERDPRTLSGGQRQRLAIGAALAAGAGALLLDEPLSQLDPAGATAVLALLGALAADGVAILLVEHRLEQAMPAATRTVLMAEGRIVADPVTSSETLRAHGLRGPALDELRARTGWAGPWRALTHDTCVTPPRGALVVSTHELSFCYNGFPRCITDVSIDVSAGERVAIVGANGAGKSTLLQLLAGHLRGTGALVRAPGAFVDVPQNPDLALFCDTVRAELAYGPREARLSPDAVAARVSFASDALAVADLLDRPPQALSRGQRLRTAVAAALACGPRLLLLDEPTSGQDREHVDRMLDALAASMAGGAVVFASHDLDVVLRHATRVLVLHEGRVVGDGPPLPTLLAADLPLPPLARLCAELGLPYLDPEALARRVEPA